MMPRPLTGAVAAVSLLLAAGIASAVAQPAGQPGAGNAAPAERERGRGGSQQPTDAKALRELIERRMEEHRSGSKRLEEALKKLDAGGDPAAIGKELLEGFRDGRRPNRTGEDGTPQRGAGGNTGGGGAGGGFGSDFGFPRTPSLSPEDRAKVRQMLEEKHPELMQKIVALAGGNAETNDRFIDSVGGRLRWLESMREKEPQEFRLRMDELVNGLDVMKLGRDISDARKNGSFDGQADAYRAQLNALMTKQFDTRQNLSKELLRQLRDRADKQAAEIAKKDQERDKSIKQRSDEFMRMLEKGKRPEKTDKNEKPDAQTPNSKP